MKNSLSAPYLTLLIALAALVVAVIALVTAKGAKEMALSEVTIEEGETVTLPLFDEEQNRFSFLVLVELHISNQGGPAVELLQLSRNLADAGFLIGLKNQEIQSGDLKPQFYAIEQPFSELQANPRLLKDVLKQSPVQDIPIRHTLESGQSRTVRYAVHFFPYDDGKRTLADLVLISTRLTFANGAIRMMRHGYPILPLVP